MEERVDSVYINLGGPFAVLQRAIQRAFDSVTFALIASEDPSSEMERKYNSLAPDIAQSGNVTASQIYLLPGTWLVPLVSANTRLNFDSAREEFRIWALGKGLQDCIEAVRDCLTKVRKICAAWGLAGKLKPTVSEWKAKVEDRPKELSRAGLRGLVEFLAKTYHASLKPPLTETVLSINDARNCLVHHNGTVNDNKGLQVRWQRWELLARGVKGQRILELPDDGKVERGERLRFRQVDKERHFARGEKILLSVQDFCEICWTLFWFGEQLRQSLRSYGESIGMHFDRTNDSGRPQD